MKKIILLLAALSILAPSLPHKLYSFSNLSPAETELSNDAFLWKTWSYLGSVTSSVVALVLLGQLIHKKELNLNSCEKTTSLLVPAAACMTSILFFIADSKSDALYQKQIDELKQRLTALENKSH